MTAISYLQGIIPEKDRDAFLSGLPKDAILAIKNNDKDFMGKLPDAAIKYLYDKSLPSPMTTTQSFGSNHPFLGHVAGTLASTGKDIANTLGKPFGIRDNTDYYNEYGVKPGEADKLAQSILPFVATEGVGSAALDALNLSSKLGASADTAGMMLSGAAGGALSSPDNTSTGALAGAVGAPVGAGVANLVGKGTRAAVKPLTSWLSGIGQGKILPRVASSLLDAKNSVPGFGEQAQSSFNEAMNRFHAAHDSANRQAQILDSMYSQNNARINPKDYVNKLNDYIKNVDSQSPVKQEPYQTAKDFAKAQLTGGIFPRTFSDAIDLHRNLNKNLSDFITKNNKSEDDVNSAKLITDLKSIIRNKILQPNENVPQIGEIKNSLENANKAYSDAMGTAKLPNSSGGLTKSNPLLQTLKSPDMPKNDAGYKFITNNPSGLEQMARTLRVDPKMMAKKLIADKVIDNSGNVNANELYKRYQNLTPTQRDAVFSKEEQNMMRVLSTAKSATTNIGGDKYKALKTFGLPIAASGLGYETDGHKGALLGFGGGLAGEFAASKILSSPNVLSWLLKNEVAKSAPTGKMPRVFGSSLMTNENNKNG